MIALHALEVVCLINGLYEGPSTDTCNLKGYKNVPIRFFLICILIYATVLTLNLYTGGFLGGMLARSGAGCDPINEGVEDRNQ